MLISHHQKFIFIHVYKVAGTSIGTALGKYCDFSSDYNNLFKRIAVATGARPQIFSKDFPGHISAEELRNQIPEKIFQTYFKFSFVRNPWDWQVSLYEYAKQNKNHHQHELTKSFSSFDSYIEWRINSNYKLQSDFLYNKEGVLLMDFVGKFETLQSDFEIVCQKLDIKHISLPHSNKTKRKDYRKYYTDYSRYLVQKTFIEDINRFGYTF